MRGSSKVHACTLSTHWPMPLPSPSTRHVLSLISFVQKLENNTNYNTHLRAECPFCYPSPPSSSPSLPLLPLLPSSPSLPLSPSSLLSLSSPPSPLSLLLPHPLPQSQRQFISYHPSSSSYNTYSLVPHFQSTPPPLCPSSQTALPVASLSPPSQLRLLALLMSFSSVLVPSLLCRVGGF
jgi:hypothetical protein